MRIDCPELPHSESALCAGRFVEQRRNRDRWLGHVETAPDAILRNIDSRRFFLGRTHDRDGMEGAIRKAKGLFTKLDEQCPSIAVVPFEYMYRDTDDWKERHWIVSSRVHGVTLYGALRTGQLDIAERARNAFSELKDYTQESHAQGELFWADPRIGQFVYGSIGGEDAQLYLIDIDPMFEHTLMGKLATLAKIHDAQDAINECFNLFDDTNDCGLELD